jgi:outer membrane protein insertion porin family
MTWYCLAGFILLPMASARDVQNPRSEPGTLVTSIRLDCDAQLKIDDFADKIIQKIGEPLDRAKVTESLRGLYATGRFLELRADLERGADGTGIVFVGRALFFVGVVRVEGLPKALDAKAFVDASRLRLGQPVFENELKEAEGRLKRALAENAYYDSRVEHHVSNDPVTQETEVIFSVSPGPPARLSRVEFQGHTMVRPERLASVARWRPGVQLTAARIDRGLLRIHRLYSAQGRLQNSTNIQKRVYDPKSRTEMLMVAVEAGPVIRVRVKGARISRSKLKELLPVYKDGVVDDQALARGEKTLEDYFERQGYFSAAVKGSRVERSGPQLIEVSYQVTLGPAGEFEGYEFRGNHAFSATELAAAMTEELNQGSHRPPEFSRELAARNAEALKDFYQSNGFLEARVTPREEQIGDGPASALTVGFDIEEGSRTKVRCLALLGIDRGTEIEIWPLLSAKPGGPYSAARVQVDRDRILGYLADRGHSQAAVTCRVSPAPVPHEMDLEYRIEPGPQDQIARVVVLGNEHTRGGIIRRELAVRQGAPLRQSDMLESQRRLYDLGIFNQVQIANQDTESAETKKTVLIEVEEARRWTLGYGGGLEVQRLGSNQPQGQFKASPRVSFDLTRLNIGGRAQTFSLGGRLSNLEKSASIGYIISPLPTTSNFRVRLSGLAERSRDVLTFTAEREESSMSVEKRYAPATLLVGRFSYRRVLVDPSTLRISPEAIPLFSRPARIAMLSASAVNDRRDDPVDATEGAYSLADAGVSWDRLGSEANFVRFSVQNATYHRLGSHLVFARNTRFQVQSPFGTSAIGPQGIPLPERFFMGGSESHRGFSINQAGPRDLVTGFPLGGNALFFNTFELRLPAGERRLGLVLFHDAGNVYSTIRKMRLLKFDQRPVTDFDYDVQAVGVGARYKTPVGPLRFDVGYNLNPPRFQVQVAPGVSEVRRLSRFQFFLSIGQSF